MDLKERCKRFTTELNVKVTLFCDAAGIGRTTYYKWMNDEIVISQKIQDRVDSYLKQYGF